MSVFLWCRYIYESPCLLSLAGGRIFACSGGWLQSDDEPTRLVDWYSLAHLKLHVCLLQVEMDRLCPVKANDSKSMFCEKQACHCVSMKISLFINLPVLSFASTRQNRWRWVYTREAICIGECPSKKLSSGLRRRQWTRAGPLRPTSVQGSFANWGMTANCIIYLRFYTSDTGLNAQHQSAKARLKACVL